MPGNNSFRIIAGQWRSRKLEFHPARDLRPTTDRIRETVFNWLMPWIEGASCLDLFAGSGALGFEAASRGASEVVLVEQDSKVVNRLRQNIELLAANNVTAARDDAFHFLQTTNRSFDIIFLDPPYRLELLEKCAVAIEQAGILKPSTCIYLEHPSQQKFNPPKQWECLKQKSAGNVNYALYQVSSD